MRAEDTYYVYALLDTSKPGPYVYGTTTFQYEPFYLGKGKNGRAKKHITNTDLRQGKFPKDKRVRKILKSGFEVKVRYLKKNLEEQAALNLERKYISKIGRSLKKEGPLLNMSPGGGSVQATVRENSIQKRFYVYALLDPTVPRILNCWGELGLDFQYEPFYVGKGTGDRASSHTYEARKIRLGSKSSITDRLRSIKDRGFKPIAVKLFEDLDSYTALAIEVEVIRILGRAQLGIGPLLNRTEGGDGNYGKILTDKNIKNMSIAATRAWASFSDTKKQRIIEHRNKCVKVYWDNATNEQKAFHSTQISKALKERGEAKEKKRKANISKGNMEHNKNNPRTVQRRVKARKATVDQWTDEQHAVFAKKVATGHANRSELDKKKTSKEMSKSGKLRVANETLEQKRSRSAALSLAQTETWATHTPEERASRSQALSVSHSNMSPKKKKAIAKKISASVVAQHTRKTDQDKAKTSAKISLTLMLKHETITDHHRKRIWAKYDAYDFTNLPQPLFRRVALYLYKHTGRAPHPDLPGLEDLNSLGKLNPTQVAQSRSINRKAKLASMSEEEIARSRSRTGLTLMYKRPEFEQCRSRLERLFIGTDFSTVTQAEFKTKAMRLVYKQTGFKHKQLKL